MKKLINQPKYPVDTVIKAAALIDALGESEQELGISTLREMVGLSASTVHRLLDTLVSIGYVQRNPETHRYRLGIGLFQIGARVMSQYGMHPDTRLYLEELATKTGETAKLGVRYYDRMVYIGLVESTNTLRYTGHVGSWGPLHCTAMGKVMLAALPLEEQDSIISRLLPLKKYTSRTIIVKEELMEELKRVKEQGYAMDVEEFLIGSCGIACPVLNEQDELAASVSIAGPLSRMTENNIKKYLPELEETAQQLRKVNIPYWQV